MGVSRLHRQSSHCAVANCIAAQESHFLPRLRDQDGHRWSTPQTGDCAIASWRSPTGNSAGSSLDCCPRDQSRDHHGSRWRAPNRETAHMPAIVGKRLFLARRNSGMLRSLVSRSVRASISRYCEDESQTRHAFDAMRQFAHSFCNHNFATCRSSDRPPAQRVRSRRHIGTTTERRRLSSFRPAKSLTNRHIAARSCLSNEDFLPCRFVS